MGFVPGAARVRQAAHGAARLERGRGTRRAESRGTGKKKGREGEGAPTGGARWQVGGAAAMRACWALAAPTGGAGGSGGSRARSEPGCGAGVLGWQRKRAWAAEALGRSGSGWARGKGNGPRIQAGRPKRGKGRGSWVGPGCWVLGPG